MTLRNKSHEIKKFCHVLQCHLNYLKWARGPQWWAKSPPLIFCICLRAQMTAIWSHAARVCGLFFQLLYFSQMKRFYYQTFRELSFWSPKMISYDKDDSFFQISSQEPSMYSKYFPAIFITII